MQLFPERSYRAGRRFLIIAAILSLFIHFTGGAIWALFRHNKVAAGPHGDPAEASVVAEAITIERRSAPHAAARARAPRAAAPAARLSRPLTLPTLPAPVMAPPREAVTRSAARPERVVVRQPRSEPQPERHVTSRQSTLSEQIAALDAESRRTIADAQREVSEGPPQPGTSLPDRGLPAGDDLRYGKIMAGNPQEIRAKLFVSGEGECVSIQGPMRVGSLNGYYLRCTVHYSDGFFEQVSFPWPFYFAPHKDPFDFRDNPYGRMSFPGQDPPSGFVLPPNFALSRAVCSYFRPQCAAIIDAERKRGEASYGTPP